MCEYENSIFHIYVFFFLNKILFTELASTFKEANDFIVGIPCDAFNVMLGINVIPGIVAFDNGTDTSNVGVAGVDDDDDVDDV